MTTTTVFASADWNIYSGDDTYTNALAGTGSTATIDGSVGGAAPGCGLGYGTGPVYRVYQSLFRFDTSAVGTDQSVTDVDFKLSWANFLTTGGDFVIEARDHPNAASAPPTFAEGFCTQSDLTGNQHFAKWDTAVEGTTTGVRTALTIVSAGHAAAAINRGGNSDISIASDGNKNASAAWSANQYANPYYIERVGTSNDPQLVVYHIDTPPGNVPMWGANF